MSVSTKEIKKETRPNLQQQRDKDREIVKGIFKFYEVPGGFLEFVYRKYKQDPVEKFSMFDGQVYSIPLGVAKHLNTNGWYPVHAFSQTENGAPVQKIGTKVRRFGFQSLEFIDIDELNQPEKQLITLEYVG